MSQSSRQGLIWVETTFELQPRWENEPNIDDIKAVCEETLKLDGTEECDKLVMRVSLSVDPGHKSAGEVSTLKWLSHRSGIPVSRVIAFDVTSNNRIGFEWILMEFIPGSTAHSRWRKMTMEDKICLVEQIASDHAQLLDLSPFHTIGTLKGTELQPIPDRIVSMMFFWGSHYNFNVDRGPFRSSYHWLSSLISIMIQDKVEEIAKAEDEEDREDAIYNLRIAQELSLLLPKIFLPEPDPPEPTILWHDDLSLPNIIVDENNYLEAIIDW
ncbi:hypothetical protein IL306_002904 [Fusarium sp. DS 682]|nr:hypothetical protein IL306_002904 [Fusarium sp. DS 682]